MRRALFLPAGLGLALLGCAPSTAELAPAAEEVGEGEHGLDVEPGDPVARGGVTVVAPDRGAGVFAEILFEDGRSHTLHLRTDREGSVFLVEDGVLGDEDVEHVASEAAGEASAAGATAPCSDSAKNPMPFSWNRRFEWSFNAGSTPGENNVANVEARLKKAATNITRSRNSCGMDDRVDATQLYLGRTTKAAQIGADASCLGTGNGSNTVGFGDLPEGVLGLACVWYDGEGHAVEADVRFNKVERRWYADKPSSCAGRFSVEAVATHEFGHVFGLGHVAEGAHGNLTMSPQINGACQGSEATLGRGDVLGLRAKY